MGEGIPFVGMLSRIRFLLGSRTLNLDGYHLHARRNDDLIVSAIGLNLFGVLPESESLGVVKALSSADRIFVDIGANVGYFTILAASLPYAHVYAFEGSMSNVRQLKKNIESNRFPDITVVHGIVAGSNRKMKLLLHRTSSGHHNAIDASDGVDPIILSEQNIDWARAVVKIDVEGMELEIIEDLMSKKPPHIIYERLHSDATSILKSNGYDTISLGDNGLAALRR